MGLVIELLILIAIAVEIYFSIADRRANKEWQDRVVKLLGEQKGVLEESNAELVDIRDATVEEEIEPV
jgi:hypothetical protein